MKTTPWFPPSIKPVHPGDYQCKQCMYRYVTGDRRSLHYWDGERWRGIAGIQRISWRGLVDKPSKGERK